MAERNPRELDDLVDEASMDSFPASDPPGYRSMSVGGPAATEPARPVPARRWHSARTVAALHGAYFVAGGMAPLLSRRAFEHVTGPKRDWWLVQAVGACVTAIGAGLVVAAARDRVTPETRVTAMMASAGLATVAAVYSVRGRISRVYLLDAAADLALIAGWIASARGQRERPPQ